MNCVGCALYLDAIDLRKVINGANQILPLSFIINILKPPVRVGTSSAGQSAAYITLLNNSMRYAWTNHLLTSSSIRFSWFAKACCWWFHETVITFYIQHVEWYLRTHSFSSILLLGELQYTWWALIKEKVRTQGNGFHVWLHTKWPTLLYSYSNEYRVDSQR